uniref:Chemosensory proteins 1 n=1 Tax=Corythucha ciliata TaxID=369451 RepID=A0A1W5ZN92_CORCT|nr:chemosensory proteins 1 [Corythucha ciliata]
MKVFAILALTFVAVSTAPQPAEEHYTDKYDSIDIDSILHNERLYKKYVACLANRGNCSPDGKTLRDNLPDALQTECKKCTEKQKELADKVLKFSLETHRADYDELAKLYDPKGVYAEKYRAEAEKRGIKI